MNKSELSLKLRDENVPETCYWLEGGTPNDRFVLNKADDIWQVYYTERGAIYEKREFGSEELACDYLYQRIKRMLKIY